MIEHLPILLIVVPLMAGPLFVLIRDRNVVLGCAITVCWTTFVGTCLLLRETLSKVHVSYFIGNWEPPYGIEYRVDTLSAFVLLFVAFIGAIVITFARASVEREIPRGKQYLFYATYMLCLTGLLGIVITGDLFNLFVFLEISALSSYALISLGRSRRSLMAAFQYLVMGTIGATFLLIGIGLIFQTTGSLNMVDISQRLSESPSSRTILVAIAFVAVGVSIKMALFPLHYWLPNAYTYAPSVVSAFIAATATKVSVYILLRLMFTIFTPGFAFTRFPIVMALSLIGIFVASNVAIFQTNVKRLLAYSSIAQIGYMLLGISFASETGLTGGILHMFNHALIKGGLFMAVACFALRLGTVNIGQLSGISRRMPWSCFAFVIGGLALIGVPLTAGFVSKWYLLIAAFDAGYWPVAALVLISSLLALVYIWKVVETMYFGELPESHEHLQEAPLSMLVPTYVVVGLTVVFGIWATIPAGIARQAALSLLESAA
jgi:multicomponent Na+:H+ antiporter subunit D